MSMIYFMLSFIKSKVCIYCDKYPSSHFICEVCGSGMCDKCNVLNIEYDLHYNRILENY